MTLTKLELEQLRQVSNIRGALAIAVDWLLIILTFWMVVRWPHTLTYFLGFLLIARQQHALLILTHDAAHGRIFSSPRWNDWLVQVLASSPVFFSLASYRHLHLKHHQGPMAPDDPDLSLTAGYPIASKSFWRKTFRDLAGISYFKILRYFLFGRVVRGEGPRKSLRVNPSYEISVPWSLGLAVITNLILFGILTALGHPWLYFFLWLLPLMTLLQFMLRLRGITEHAGYAYHKNQMLCSRTVKTSWQTWIMAPHSVNYHIEHHSYPSIPFYRLHQAHRLLKERHSLPEKNVYTDYKQVIQDLVK